MWPSWSTRPQPLTPLVPFLHGPDEGDALASCCRRRGTPAPKRRLPAGTGLCRSWSPKRPARAEPAVEDEALSRHVRRERGREEHRRVSHLVWLAVASHRHLTGLVRWLRPTRDGCRDGTAPDDVHADAIAGVLRADGPGEAR